MEPVLSVKAEYLLFDFGKDSNSYTDNNNDGDTYKIDHDLQINTLKVGINYHFASAYAAPLK